MSLTTDPTDPKLGHGADSTPVTQNEKYLVLSEEERAKGFVRPVRTSYVHVGLKPKNTLRDLTEDEKERYAQFAYVKYEKYPESEAPVAGRYWTQADLDNHGCGASTSMALPLAETYARNPKFYGSTYCCGCSKHRPVAEFVWQGTDEIVGS